MKHTLLFVALSLALSVSLWAAPDSLHSGHGKHSPAHAHTPSPAPEKLADGVLALDVYADSGKIYVLTAEMAGDGPPRLLLSSSSDQGRSWTTSRRVDLGPSPLHSPRHGNDPQIAVDGERIVVAWTTEGTDDWGSGPIAIAYSADGGQSWKVGGNPADDGRTTGHAFHDLAVDSNGDFHIVWLDNRDGKQGLYHASSADGGASWSKNRTLKAGSCECCQNALATDTKGNVAVLFRDHDPRDMKVISCRQGQWSDLITVGDFGWRLEACPHAGGGIAFTDAGIHSLVWTGAERHRGIHHVRPGSEPTALGGPDAAQPDLAATADGVLLATWQLATPEGMVIQASQSKDEGKTWSDPVTLSNGVLTATHPQVVASEGGFLVVWTELPDNAPNQWRSKWVAVEK